MYIVSESWFPASKAREIAKMYLAVMQKYPDDPLIFKPIVQASIHAVKEGLHTIGISSVEPGKTKEAMDLVTKRELMTSSIEGYRYHLYIAYNITEAMQLIGSPMLK